MLSRLSLLAGYPAMIQPRFALQNWMNKVSETNVIQNERT